MSQDDKVGDDGRLVVAINGGPRKNWNTFLLLEEALRGASDAGARTLRYDLFEMNFKGCVSCFYCKTKENYHKGKCAQKDDLAPVLKTLKDATGLVMGSPIYLSDVTGSLRNFWERYVFQNIIYSNTEQSVLERGPGMGVIYTMNIPEDMMPVMNYDILLSSHFYFLERLNPPILEQICSCDTLQFNDYDKYYAPMFNSEAKKRSRELEFPGDLHKAYELGFRLGQVKEKQRIRNA
ncbi:MAG: flavodoxin family protein [Deltaproteobacteria bacterium]|jgi:multimeric flavodoxin WrbA|nr:flavodoxin family protein [Deltaproteobacteria bacterium]